MCKLQIANLRRQIGKTGCHLARRVVYYDATRVRNSSSPSATLPIETKLFVALVISFFFLFFFVPWADTRRVRYNGMTYTRRAKVKEKFISDHCYNESLSCDKQVIFGTEEITFNI